MTRHVPTPVKLTTPPEIVQTALLPLSMLNETLRPELAVAEGV